MSMKKEVDKIFKAGYITKVCYLDWMANVVMDKMNQWYICVDFTYLNKAYPKENFPMLKIEQLIDVMVEHSTFSFMDAYSRYNQIKMFELNRDMTSFMTHQGLFYYRVILF